MTMKTISAVDLLADDYTAGNFILLWGETNVGKTISSLLTSWGNILVINPERDIKPNVELAVKLGRNVNEMRVYNYIDYENLRASLSDLSNFKDIDVILFDGISSTMKNLISEASDDSYDQKYGESGADSKAMAKRMKGSEEDWGTMANAMNDIIRRLVVISKTGVTIVCTARLGAPTLEQRIAGYDQVPYFKGKAFGKDADADFDFIGRVKKAVTANEDKAEKPLMPALDDSGQPRFTADNKPIFISIAPSVSFNLPRVWTKRTGMPPDEKGWNGIALDLKKICRIGDEDESEVKPKIEEK